MSLISFFNTTLKKDKKHSYNSDKYYRNKALFYTRYLEKYNRDYYHHLHGKCTSKHLANSDLKIFHSKVALGDSYYMVLDKLGLPSFSYEIKENSRHLILAYKSLKGSVFITETFHFFEEELFMIGYDYANLSPTDQESELRSFLDKIQLEHLEKLENPFLVEDFEGNFMLAHQRDRLKIYIGSSVVFKL